LIRSLRLTALALGIAGLISGCRSLPMLAPSAGDAAVPLWQVPPGELPSQRLFRAAYEGPEGDGSFRLTLKLFSPDRYWAQASDPLGRVWFSLDVAGQEGFWADHRGRVFCPFSGELPVVGRELGAFSPAVVPALLLGRLPAVEPVSVLSEAGDELDLRDALGRRFTVQRSGGRLVSWSLREGEEPVLWWGRKGDWALLSHRRRGVQIRFKEVVRERLADPAPALAPPSGYREINCGDGPMGLVPGLEDRPGPSAGR
jgi:hypothetical protein